MSAVDGSPAQWIEIDGGVLRRNLALFANLVSPGTEMAVVVKANAYGHGLEQVAPIAADVAQWLAVHSAGEARAIRRLGLGLPILVMGFVPPSEMYDLDADIHVMLSTIEVLEWLGDYRARSGVAIPIHIKVDTGTRRQGVSRERAPDLIRRAAALGLDIVGLATHFANIEDTLEHEFARFQLREFNRALEETTAELGGRPPYVHAACSAAALLFRETDFSLVRIGISAYGYWSSRETRLSWKHLGRSEEMQLEPVLTWRAQVGQLQRVPKGATVGYGRTWTALRETMLAVLPVGYADGYARALGNQSRVIIRGSAASVVGRVCMNIMMVDVTDVPGVEVGDEVVLIGRAGEQEITVEELAGLTGTINYEFVTRISPEIPRRVVGDESA